MKNTLNLLVLLGLVSAPSFADEETKFRLMEQARRLDAVQKPSNTTMGRKKVEPPVKPRPVLTTSKNKMRAPIPVRPYSPPSSITIYDKNDRANIYSPVNRKEELKQRTIADATVLLKMKDKKKVAEGIRLLSRDSVYTEELIQMVIKEVKLHHSVTEFVGLEYLSLVISQDPRRDITEVMLDSMMNGSPEAKAQIEAMVVAERPQMTDVRLIDAVVNYQKE